MGLLVLFWSRVGGRDGGAPRGKYGVPEVDSRVLFCFPCEFEVTEESRLVLHVKFCFCPLAECAERVLFRLMCENECNLTVSYLAGWNFGSGLI